MITITNVVFFEDRNLKKPFNTVYSIEIEGNKLRVINPYSGIFGMGEKSRLNKFVCNGSITGGPDIANKYFYTTIVNGKRVYFKLSNKIH